MSQSAADNESEPVPFDLTGELPGAGITLLEASAGTGKTYTIAALVARYVAEGVPISAFLVITFTLAATSELRDRVRRRIEKAERGLDRYLATGAVGAHDTLIEVLTQGDREQIKLRRQRLSAALANFDAASITTTHGFCLDALAGLGLSGDCELDPVFAPDISELVDQVLDDEYVRLFYSTETPLPYGEARRIVQTVNSNFDARIEPAIGPETNAEIRSRVELATAARREIARRKRLGGLATFDDLVARLHAAVIDSERGAQAISTLQSRYRIVLVDEFQDTDNLQWAALQTAFGAGSTTLLLIGDPKQAIYGFRGADIYAYLGASSRATDKRTLTRNFRSTSRLLEGLDLLFGSAELGDAQIRYRRVVAGDPSHVGDPDRAPLRIRVVGDQAPVQRTAKENQCFQIDSANAFVARDLASDIASKLNENGARPEQIAVLVPLHRHAKLIHEALDAAGVPVVIRGSRSVLETSAAQSWLWLLEALDRPSSASAVRRLASTPFLGWSTERIAGATDADWAALHRQVSSWAQVLSEHGVAALQDTVARATALLSRMLAVPDGERDVTDLQHVGELINEQSVTELRGAGALAAWLHERISESLESDEDERARRLDSDAQAVQVITIHAAKGLEFPIVYCPFLWHAPQGAGNQPLPPVIHANGQRVVNVGGPGASGYDAAAQRRAEERMGESLRLAYVALTRAQDEVVIWWVRGVGVVRSPLSRIVATSRSVGDSVPGRLMALASASDTVSCSLLEALPDLVRWSGADSNDRVDLGVNTLGRPIDNFWRRSSFSALTSKAHEAHVGSESGVWQKVDEADLDVVSDPTGSALSPDSVAALRAVELPLAKVPAGASIGTFVHSVLEHVDFAAADLRGVLNAEVARQLSLRRLGSVDPEVVTVGLGLVLRTPLDSDADSRSLRDYGIADRINEMGFEYAVAGGSLVCGSLTIDAIRSLLEEYVPVGDPLSGYADRLAEPELATTLRGYLLGSIDVVLRTPTSGADARFSVADYKTNRLGPADELSAWHYRPEALRDAMFDAHYPLQFLIYTVALHRYLRWRLPGYDPAVNLGPVKYLFVRGMIGAPTPVVDGQRCGVYSWQPSAELVCALSDLMADGVSS